jgi:hypothetical protein
MDRRLGHGGSGGSRLWPIYVFSFLNSIGTGVVTNGIVFFTKQSYHFSDTQNYLLAVVLGVTYIAGALLAQPGVEWTRAKWGWSSRGILAGMMVVMGLLCALPWVAQWAQGLSAPASAAVLAENRGGAESEVGGTAVRSAAPIWIMIVLYSPLTGVLWPMVESYVSGGRSGSELRATVSRWNVVWSSALVFAYVGISPFVKDYAVVAVLLLGVVHLASALVLMAFEAEPAEHREEEHDPHPPVFSKLLVTFRLLLPMSYVVSSALGPYLPSAEGRLSVPEHLQTILAASWLAPRAVMFEVLARWHGWHGRWFPAIVGPVLLLAGFGVAILSGSGAAGRYGVATLAAGLGLFGIGMAVIYSGALYYALEVGKAEVQAGGKHEALIGAGYTAGPLIGLSANLAVGAGLMAKGRFEPVVLGVVTVVAAGFAAVAARRVIRHSRAVRAG